MIVEITPDGYLPCTEEKPIVGRKYYLEIADDYSKEQRKAWEALVTCFYVSGTSPWPGKTRDDLREIIKRDYGQGFESYIYVDPFGNIKKEKNLIDIPESIRKDRRRILGKLKSTTKYTKKQFTALVDATISLMHQSGCTSKKFFEILEGMEDAKRLFS